MMKNLKPTPCFIALYKPSGPSSTQWLNLFKKNCLRGQRVKVGHVGTLDPFASGLLLVAIGGATRLSNMVHSTYSKTYRARGVFGKRTDSGDKTGKVIDQGPGCFKGKEEAQRIWRTLFLGDYWQTPPQFSATKHEGVPLYKWARKGVHIQKEAVHRKVFDLKVESLSEDEVCFEVEVSSGTYIRTLFEEMASEVNSQGHLLELCRTSIGPVEIKNCLQEKHWKETPLESIWEKKDEPWHFSVEDILPLTQLQLPAHLAKAFANGNSLPLSEISKERQIDGTIESQMWVHGEQLIGLANVQEGRVYPKINFA